MAARSIAVAVSRELGDIPAMTASEAARALRVGTARVAQLIKAGSLDSWKDGTTAHECPRRQSMPASNTRESGRPKVAALV